MTREMAIEICKGFCELNKWKSDYNGQLAGAIETLLNERVEVSGKHIEPLIAKNTADNARF